MQNTIRVFFGFFCIPTVDTDDPPSSNTATASDNSSWVLGTTVRMLRMSRA